MVKGFDMSQYRTFEAILILPLGPGYRAGKEADE